MCADQLNEALLDIPHRRVGTKLNNNLEIIESTERTTITKTTMASLPTAAEILKRFYDAESVYMAAPSGERDFAGGMGKVLSPKVEIHQSPDLPYSQSLYEGHEGFIKWSEEMAGFFDKLEVTDPQVFEREGADEVVVSSVLKLRTRNGGKEWEAPLLQTIGVDREKGWLLFIRPFYWNVGGLKEVVGK